MSDYDVIFIGGGPAGYEGAILAGKRGLRTAVVERDRLGGTCLQRGCIPTKAILHSVKLIREIHHSEKLGITVDGMRFSLPAILQRKNRVVSKLTRGIELQFKKNGVDLISGNATLEADNVVTVNQDRYRARHVIVATGSVAADLPFLRFDHQRVLSSDDLLQLEQAPPQLLVIGAGAVGIEWSLIYRYLGSKVTLVEMMPQVLPGSDGEIAGIIRNELVKQEIVVHTAASVRSASVDPGKGVTVSIKKGDKEWSDQFTHVLLAVGRKPLTEGLSLAPLGIETDAKGFIKVNANLQTGKPAVFACGDVIGPPLLAHKASHQALAIVDFVTSGKPVEHRAVPAAVFSFPEMASVGLTEEEAKKNGIQPLIGRFPYSAGSRANAVEEKTGLVKIIADQESQIIGAHIVGADAAELMPLFTFAIEKRMRAEEFRDLVFIHPTLSEMLWEALGEIGRFSIHI